MSQRNSISRREFEELQESFRSLSRSVSASSTLERRKVINKNLIEMLRTKNPTIKLLNYKNYNKWKVSIRDLLVENKVEKFINRNINSSLEMQRNKKIIRILRMYISEDILSTIDKNFETAYDFWCEIETLLNLGDRNNSSAQQLIYDLQSKTESDYKLIFKKLNEAFNMLELNMDNKFPDEYKITVFFKCINPKDAISIKQHQISNKLDWYRLQNYAITYQCDLNMVVESTKTSTFALNTSRRYRRYYSRGFRNRGYNGNRFGWRNYQNFRNESMKSQYNELPNFDFDGQKIGNINSNGYVGMLMNMNSPEPSDDWIVDTGSALLICNDKSKFVEGSLVPTNSKFYMADNKSTVPSLGIGKIKLVLDNKVTFTLNNVYYCPTVFSNLFNFSIFKSNTLLKISNDSLYATYNNINFKLANFKNPFYYLNVTGKKEIRPVENYTFFLHKVFGHCNPLKLRLICKIFRS